MDFVSAGKNTLLLYVTEKCSFQVSCQFNVKLGAISQLRLGDRLVDPDRPVCHLWPRSYHRYISLLNPK